MLVRFSVHNFRSFGKDRATLDMRAVSAFKELKEESVFSSLPVKQKLLKSAGIFGANAFGKSNFIKALVFMKDFVENSARGQFGDPIDVEPFKLNDAAEIFPSSFGIEFLIDRTLYDYGFSVTKTRVEEEWLRVSRNGRKKQLLFKREGQGFHDIHRAFGKDYNGAIADKTRDNALFISTAAQFNGPVSKEVITWFKKLNCIWMAQNSNPKKTLSILEDMPEARSLINKLLKVADFGLAGVEVQEGELFGVHRSNDEGGGHRRVLFPFEEMESYGTRKYFKLAGPIVEALRNGGVLLVDELDSSMHPWMVRAIVSLFNSSMSNQSGQLIFSAHSSPVMSRNLMRRDQIWFAEKNANGESSLHPLSDFKVRNTAAIEKRYLEGSYGGVPDIGDIQMVFKKQ